MDKPITKIMRNRIKWSLIAIMCIGVGLYPLLYFLMDPPYGLLNLKTGDVLNNIWFQIGFNTHIIFGGIALSTGWFQFNKKWRNANLKRHRILGRIYITTAIISATAGLFIAQFASGGLYTALGFFILGLVWFYSTFFGFWAIRQYDIFRHQQLMIISFAACFGAVTLRAWLPLLEWFTGDFITAYQIVAWLSWVPNIIVGTWIALSIKPTVETFPELEG